MTKDKRYPYRHHGPSVLESKFVDYLVSEQALREDRPELFDHEKEADHGAQEEDRREQGIE